MSYCLVTAIAVVLVSAIAIINSISIRHAEKEIDTVKGDLSEGFKAVSFEKVTNLLNTVEGIEDDIDEITDDSENHEMQIARANDLIADIIAKLEAITADIHQIDERTKKDHCDLVDIRTRYVNFRNPVQSNAGVEWSNDHKCKEDE